MTGRPLQEVALHSLIRDDHVAAYREDHVRIPDGLAAAFDEVGIRDWRIWRSGRHLFHLVTCEDFDAAMAALAQHPANLAWQAHIGAHVLRFEDADGREGTAPSERIWSLDEQRG